MKWRVTKRYPALGNDGRRYTVVEMRNGRDIDFILDNGAAITRQADGAFQVDETGEMLSIPFDE